MWEDLKTAGFVVTLEDGSEVIPKERHKQFKHPHEKGLTFDADGYCIPDTESKIAQLAAQGIAKRSRESQLQ